MRESVAVGGKGPELGAGVVVYAVEGGKKVTAGRPSVVAMPNGRLLVAFDLTGPDAKGLPGKKGVDPRGNRWSQTKVFSSGDGGATWASVATLPLRCGGMFRDGGDVYLLGESGGNLQVARSPDGGGSWSMPSEVLAASGSAGGAEYTPFLAGPVAVGDWWVGLAWRGDGAGWSAFRVPRGTALTGRKAWVAGEGCGALQALPGTMEASGAGIPAGGVHVGYRSFSAGLVPLGEGHPWAGGAGAGGKNAALAVFSTMTGRKDVAAGVVLDGEGLGFSPLGGAAAPWVWVGVPGAHAAFSMAEAGDGAVLVAGNVARPGAWGREVLDDGARSRIGLWRAEVFPEFEWVAGLGDGKVAATEVPVPAAAAAEAGAGSRGGERREDRGRRGGRDRGRGYGGGGGGRPEVAPGAFAGIRRDPAVAVGGASAWIACRCGTMASRHASDCLEIRMYKANLEK